MKTTVIRDPVVVFEVLSESTSRTDRIEKLREYGATPSIQRYIILEQDTIAATVYVRKGYGSGRGNVDRGRHAPHAGNRRRTAVD